MPDTHTAEGWITIPPEQVAQARADAVEQAAYHRDALAREEAFIRILDEG